MTSCFSKLHFSLWCIGCFLVQTHQSLVKIKLCVNFFFRFLKIRFKTKLLLEQSGCEIKKKIKKNKVDVFNRKINTIFFKISLQVVRVSHRLVTNY